MKEVLLLGDSIRLSYQPIVKEKLDGLAEVVGPEDNCRFTKYTLWSVNTWLKEFGKPDIIHWNNGIWDIFHIDEHMGIFTPLEEYLSNIGRILKELRKTKAEIIWAATTPVSNKNINCRNSEIDEYNCKAQEFMQSEHILVNDLNSIVKKNIGLYICEDNLHLSESGKQVCSEAVVKAIMQYL